MTISKLSATGLIALDLRLLMSHSGMVALGRL